jgi:hypothetical protein
VGGVRWWGGAEFKDGMGCIRARIMHGLPFALHICFFPPTLI